MNFEDFLRNRRYDPLPPEDIAILKAAVGEIRTVPARKTMIRRGEAVATSTYLIDGFMCRYMDDQDGQRQTVALNVAGDFVDLHGYPLKRLDHDLATLTECRIASIPHGRIDEIVASRPSLVKPLWFSTLLDAAMHREWIFRLGRLEAIARVGHFFCETEAKLRAVRRSDGAHFALPMTQVDLGEACGMTPVHMNRMLRELKERGLLEMRAGQVSILDRNNLERISEFEPSYLFIRP